VVEKVTRTHQELSATRKKRTPPTSWATPDIISSLTPVHTSEVIYPGARSVILNGDLALFGGADGAAGIYSISQQQLLTPLKCEDGPITDAAWFGARPVTASASGSVRIWDENGSGNMKIGSHAGEATAITIHPCGDILASVGIDKSWVTYDLNTGKAVCQIYTESEITSAHFHPDGQLLGMGTNDATVLIYDVAGAKLAATFGPLTGPVQSLHFSENGYWLAISVKGETTIQIWDLRKAVNSKVLDTGAQVNSIKWDYTGQFLAAVGPSGIHVQQYSKATKSWSEVLQKGVPGVDIAWGPSATSLVTVSKEGAISVMSIQPA